MEKKDETVKYTIDSIKEWMRKDVVKNGFVNATTEAERFFKEYHITDTLDPDFSLTLDAAFELASEIREKKLNQL
jgi:hypothetical protein